VPDYSNRNQQAGAVDEYNQLTCEVHVHRTITFSVVLALISVSSRFAIPQIIPDASQQGPGPTIQRPNISQPDNNPGLPPEFEKKMQKKANEQRQADLKRDTERLLKLSTELKEYVDKTNSNILSMDVIKKAEEIEKLAHSVRVKMRGD
jgi:hypothetical protein